MKPKAITSYFAIFEVMNFNVWLLSVASILGLAFALSLTSLINGSNIFSFVKHFLSFLWYTYGTFLGESLPSIHITWLAFK